ncbi:MAG: hypothetical protein ACOYL3_02575 [Desulfuromonadaceae bacterium]
MTKETSIIFDGNFDELAEGRILRKAFMKALAIDTKLPPGIRDMEGMSGKKYRYFINNLVELSENPRYLEVGSWVGSTACSALYGNNVKALCIDNWSEFGGPREVFLQNINAVKATANIDFNFLESDFRHVDYGHLGKFNIFLFDGPHTEEDQYSGVFLTESALDDVYTFIVDDWNWEAVRMGTLSAIRRCDINVISSIVIRTTQDDTFPEIAFQKSDWHNGYLIAVCKKKYLKKYAVKKQTFMDIYNRKLTFQHLYYDKEDPSPWN